MNGRIVLLLISIGLGVFLFTFWPIFVSPDNCKIAAGQFTSVKSGGIYPVKKIWVIQAHLLHVELFDGTKLKGRLRVLSTKDAAYQLVRFLNAPVSRKPQVKLLNRNDDHIWDVEILVVENDKQITISEWLSEGNLVYREW